MQQLAAAGIVFKDLQTTQSSLEDIFVSLVHEKTHEKVHEKAPEKVQTKEAA